MSTVMDTVFPVAKVVPGSALSSPAEIREGDWQAYLERMAEWRTGTSRLEDREVLLDYKRQCAFAYLGKRAQKQGGVYSKRPRVLAPEVIARLEESNRTKRYARYPWIEKLLRLMAEIELLQEESASAQNVFSLIQPARNN